MSTGLWGTFLWGGDDTYATLATVRSIEVQVTHEFSGLAPVWTDATTWIVAPTTEMSALDNVLGNTVYAARARYLDVYGAASAWSLIAYHRTVRDTTAPGVPTSVAATSTGAGLLITWTGVTDADLAHYEVRTSPNSGGSPTGTWTTYKALSTSLTIPIVSGALWIQVRAVDSSGNAGGWS